MCTMKEHTVGLWCQICIWCKHKHIHHLLLVYFGSVDLSFLDVCGGVGLPRLVIIEDHLSHQHHQLVQILPLLQHKVTRVAGHWHKHINALTRLKDKEEENEVNEAASNLIHRPLRNPFLEEKCTTKQMMNHDKGDKVCLSPHTWGSSSRGGIGSGCISVLVVVEDSSAPSRGWVEALTIRFGTELPRVIFSALRPRNLEKHKYTKSPSN